MVYAALLRGINVGGNNKIDMKLLKAGFERAGMKSVVTYINSGNIMFADEDNRTREELSAILEKVILDDFGLHIKVLVVSMEKMELVMKALPDFWTNDQQMRSDVIFLWEEIDDESVLDKLAIKPEVDTVMYVPGAILWSVDRADATKSGMNKLIGSAIYRQITVRNVNTARKIYSIMQGICRSF